MVERHQEAQTGAASGEVWPHGTAHSPKSLLGPQEVETRLLHVHLQTETKWVRQEVQQLDRQTAVMFNTYHHQLHQSVFPQVLQS